MGHLYPSFTDLWNRNNDTNGNKRDKAKNNLEGHGKINALHQTQRLHPSHKDLRHHREDFKTKMEIYQTYREKTSGK